MSEMRQQSPEQLDVRPARAEDREAVLAFCAHTWSEGDYIEDVWEDWLHDARGALLVAVSQDRPIGLIHVALFSDDEAWLEGIRVDPAQRRRGVGRVLVSRALVAARERGAKVVRLFTDHDNIASQGLITGFGFKRVAEVSHYEAPALTPEEHGAGDMVSELASTDEEKTVEVERTDLRVEREDDAPPPSDGKAPAEGANELRLTIAGAEDFERIWSWLEHSNLAPFNGGLEFIGWHARAVTEPGLRAYLDAGQVYLLEEWDTIQSLAVAVPRPRQYDAPATLEVRYLDGAADWISRLALVLREIAAEDESSRMALWLPDLLILRDAMNGAGYTRPYEGVLWVYARAL
ncbi:MAG: N-acetyltransferase family protein [Ktedonobacterales bacterium]